MFTKKELKNGEFPKIFKFSKLDFSQITGKFNLREDKKPDLFNFPDGTIRDQEGHICLPRGYLSDLEGNVTDRSGNIFFEKHLLSNDGRLPLLF